MKINLPNKLTLVRIALIPIFVLLMFFEQSFWCQLAAAVVFIGASVTDYLDGFIARKNNIVTNFGKFADPIADKMLVMSAFIMLVAQGRMPAWVCIIFLGREFAVSGLRMVAGPKGKVIAAGKSGKFKTASTMVGLCAMMALGGVEMFAWINPVVISIIIVTTVYSGVEYFVQNWKCLL